MSSSGGFEVQVLKDAESNRMRAPFDGDPEAVRQVLAAIRPFVVRYCRARIGRQEGSFAPADEVAQEVCLSVLAYSRSYLVQDRPFLAFVYDIARRTVAEAFPGPPAFSGEVNEPISRLLRVLPENQQEIVVLRVVAGLSVEETADAVASSPSAVRLDQHRALAQLRTIADD
jgi:RNA polymerase sigma-70 factor (ECF subfamily)